MTLCFGPGISFLNLINAKFLALRFDKKMPSFLQITYVCLTGWVAFIVFVSYVTYVTPSSRTQYGQGDTYTSTYFKRVVLYFGLSVLCPIHARSDTDHHQFLECPCFLN